MTGRWAALAVVFLTRVSMGFQFQSVASLSPFLVDEFGLSYAQVGWLMGLYLLPGGAIALPGGVLGQRFGERRVVLWGLALMAAGGVVTAVSRSFGLACAGRAVAGTGGVLLNVLLAKMVADWFRDREMSTAMGVMLSAWPAGIALAMATLGALAQHAAWRGATFSTAIGALLAAGLMFALYAEPTRGLRPPATQSLRLALPRRVLALAVVAGLAWAAFNAAFIVLVSFAPGLLMARGATLVQAGVLASVAIWVSLVSVPAGGWVADRVRARDRVIVAGCLACASAMAAIPLVEPPGLGLVLAGLMVGLPPGAIMALLPETVPAVHLAAALGVYYTVYYLGMAMAQPAAGLVRDLTGNPAAPLLFAAAVMAATVAGLAAFRRLAPADWRARRLDPACPS